MAMTFATFLCVVFASEIVTGDTFPKFVNVKAESLYVMVFLQQCKPATNQDVAKMLVWAFIAGHLERFVPNIISRIQSDAEEKTWEAASKQMRRKPSGALLKARGCFVVDSRLGRGKA
jgi:hypothetical protein